MNNPAIMPSITYAFGALVGIASSSLFSAQNPVSTPVQASTPVSAPVQAATPASTTDQASEPVISTPTHSMADLVTQAQQILQILDPKKSSNSIMDGSSTGYYPLVNASDGIIKSMGLPGSHFYGTKWKEIPGHDLYLLVTADQLKEFGWADISDTFVDDLNRTLMTYGITDKESICLFMATMAVESDWGKDTLENGTDEYFAANGYSKYTRGAGYMQITGRDTQVSFLTFMNDIMYGKNTAQYIADNYAIESSTWYWSIMRKTGEGNLNAYVEKNGDSLGVFLITQYYTNGFPDGIGRNLTSIREGNSYMINKDKNGNSISLSVNGNTYALPNGWDMRENAYNKAIKVFG